MTFEEFKSHIIEENPEYKRSSDAYLRQLYERQVGDSEGTRLDKEERRKIKNILVTTEDYPPHPVKERVDIITAECAFGMNVFRDIFAGVRDIVGGRSDATQKVLRDARKQVLFELREEAYHAGADGVIGVSLSYNEFSGKGKSMLFLVATGTAVVFEEEDA